MRIALVITSIAIVAFHGAVGAESLPACAHVSTLVDEAVRPLLTDAERRYLSCDATCEVWFERSGEVIGAGRATRLISRIRSTIAISSLNGAGVSSK